MKSNSLIRFRIDGGELQTIPSSEWARILRYLDSNRHVWLTILEIVIALRTVEVHPRLTQLRGRFGILIDTQPVPESEGGRGRKLLYRLNPRVEVVEEATNE